MKKIFILLMFIGSLVGGATKLVYDKIDDLKKELLQVKDLNMKLSKSNVELESKNKQLDEEKKNLINKQKRVQKELKERRAKVSQKVLKKATNKIGKAAVGVIPFVGTGAVAALTYDEVKGYCNDLKEDRLFLNSLYPDQKVNESNEEKIICGYDKNLIEEKVLKDLNVLNKEFFGFFNSLYEKTSEYVEEEYINFKKEYYPDTMLSN